MIIDGIQIVSSEHRATRAERCEHKHFIGTTAALIAGGLSAAGAIGGGAVASAGGQKAASTAANASLAAAQLQHSDATDALNFNKGQYANTQAEQAPYLNAGYSGLSNLAYQLGILPNGGATSTNGGGMPSFTAGSNTASVPADPFAQYNGKSFSALVNSGDPNVSPNKETTAQWTAGGVPFKTITTSDGRQVAVRDTSGGNVPSPASAGINIPTNLADLANPNLGAFGSLSQDFTDKFQAPTDVTEQNDPGYQFRLKQGQQLLENSAAAKGGLFSGGTAKAEQQFGQDYASNEYSNVYNRAFNDFSTKYNIFKQNQADKFNRLASVSGIGQTAASQLGLIGQNASNTNANIALTSGQQIGNSVQNAGNARASGYQNSGNILGSTLSNLPSSLTSLYLMSKILPNSGGGGSTGGSGFPTGDFPGI